MALARLAGLRSPSELTPLTWADVNWEKGRLTVRACKTEHHGGDHAVRVVPICPELRAILAEASARAEPGETAIVPLAARKGVNLRTQFERIIAKAGHKPWPRLFQNLRASCATDWVEKYPSHVVAKWLGHSPKVAAQHYLMSREYHFEDVVRGDGQGAPATVFGSVPPEPCCADCSADAVQIADQQGPAPDRTEPHETTEPAAAKRLAAGSSEVTPFLKTAEMAGTGAALSTLSADMAKFLEGCCADCSAPAQDRIDLLAKVVLLVARVPLPETDQAAVLTRVVAMFEKEAPLPR